MKKSTILCAALLWVAALCGVGAGFAQENDANKTSGNPLFPGWYADPEVATFDGKYWIFPTYSDHFDKQTFFDCF
ncbi:MAG: hypothetical protein IKY61_03800, partial [Thermoguttaceae bacterium]|nr:hypothetical protein [Thermoguttaceae bacterium]